MILHGYWFSTLSKHSFLLKIALTSCTLFASLVYAQPITVEITEETTEPLATSTVDNGAEGNIEVTSTGSITLAETAVLPAITLDSSNTISLDGTVEVNNINGIQGLLLQGDNDSVVTINGNLSILEDFVREDLDGDGDLDGDFAIGFDRVGILVDGVSALRSDIILGSNAVLSVEGNNSAGIQVSSGLEGNIRVDGAITSVGSNSANVLIDSVMTGDISIRGTVFTIGEASNSLLVTEDITGSLSNSGTITTTGFASTTLSNYIDPNFVTDNTLPLEDRIDAEDLLIGGSAISVQASISEGILNNGNIDSFLDADELADETKDTIEDFDENRSFGTISVFGSAPAIEIAAEVDGTNNDLVIGRVVEDVIDTLDDDEDGDFTEVLATFNNDYGLINRGTISSNGLNQGISSTTISIQGASDGSRSTLIEGGFFNSGTITANAVEASAEAIVIGDFAVVPVLINEGSLTTFSESTGTDASRVISVSADAELNQLINSGTINADSLGDDINAVAIQDLSGTLVNITNNNFIGASTTPRDELNTGTAVAIDLSGHQVGQDIRFVQERLVPVDDINGDDVLDDDDVAIPTLFGDVLFGAGDDIADIRDGDVAALNFDFGDGADQLLISGGASVLAELNGVEQIALDNGSLFLSNSSSIALDSLSIENESNLTLALDLTNIDTTVAALDVMGAAVIDDTSSISTLFNGFEADDFDVLLIEAGTLDLGTDADIIVDLELPTIYTQTITADATSLLVSFEARSAADIGFQESRNSAFDALLTLAESDERVGTQLTSYTEDAALLEDFEQLLPDLQQVAVNFLMSQTDLSSSLTGNRLQHIRREGAGQWFQYTIGRGAQSTTEERVSYSGTETNFSLGVDQQLSDTFYAGASISLRTNDYLIDKSADHNLRTSAFDLGLYSSYQLGSFGFDTSLTIGSVEQFSDRFVTFGEQSESYEANWDGEYFGASSLLSYQQNFGDYFVRPSASFDYFSMSEDDYEETVINDIGSLALGVQGVDTTLLSSTFRLSFGKESWSTNSLGKEFGQSWQFYAGYRENLSSDSYASQARFLTNDETFDITGGLSDEGGVIVGANITLLSSDQNSVTVGYAGEQIDEFARHSFQAEIRIAF